MLSQRYSPKVLEQALVPAYKWHPFPRARETAAWVEWTTAAARENILRRAQDRLDDTDNLWPALPATLYMDFVRTGTRTRFEAPHRQRRETLADLVTAACLAEDHTPFLDAVVDGIWALCEESHWGLPAHMHAQKAGPGLPDPHENIVDLMVGETAALLAWTSYLLAAELDAETPLIRARIRRDIQTRLCDPLARRDDFWWMGTAGQRVNNWNPWIVSNWLTALLLLDDDTQHRSAQVHRAMTVVDHFIDQHPADGGCDEGPGYWGRAGASLFDALDLLHSASNGVVDCFSEPLIGNLARFIGHAHISGDYFANFADAPARLLPDGATVYAFGAAVRDPVLQSFGRWLAQRRTQDAAGKGQSLLRRLRRLSLDSVLTAAPGAPPLEDLAWLPDIQVMFAREREGADAGFFLAAKGGHNDESHNHNDVGTFILYRDGRPVLVDVGVGTYRRQTFSPERYGIWTMRSEFHNLPTVNGMQQLSGRLYAARDARCSTGDGTSGLHLNITDAYPPAAGIHNWCRSVSLTDNGTVVLEDAFELKNPTQDIVLSLMTPCAVATGAPGTLKLQPAPMPGDRQSGAASLHFDGGAFAADVETVAVGDSRLEACWGPSLHRILLRPLEPLARAVWTLRIVK